MVLGKMRQAARQGRAEAALRRILSDFGAEAEIILRQRGQDLTASVVMTKQPAEDILAGLEAALQAVDEVASVTLVTSDHGRAAPAKEPQKPLAGGGHGDPLRLGSRPQERQGPSRPPGVKAVIAVASGKGGVGKSTVAAGLALELKRRGHRVGLLDLDIYGPSLPVLFPSEGRLKGENGKILPAEIAGLRLVSIGYMVDERQAVAWRGPMVMNAARQLIEDTAWGELDVLIVDTPPGTGDAHLSMIQRLTLDAAVLVATPSPLASADVRRGAELFRKTGARVIGVVANMTGGPMGDSLDQNLLDELELPVLDTLPLGPANAAVPLSEDSGVPLPGLADAAEDILRRVAA